MKPDTIIIHHSFSRDQKTRDWDAIRRFHMSWRFAGESITAEQAHKFASEGKRIEAPWSDIGYHFGVELTETGYMVCVGRAENISGAHCSQQAMNSHSLGVCFVGNFDLGPVPKEQWEKGVELVARLCIRHLIKPPRIFGHRDFASYKSCPGTHFVIEQFREDVARFLL